MTCLAHLVVSGRFKATNKWVAMYFAYSKVYVLLQVFALHPLYLSLRALGDNLPQDIQGQIEEAREQLEGTQVGQFA